MTMEYHPEKPVPLHMQWVIILFVYLLAVLTYSVFYTDSMFIDGDSPWHLAAGDYIRDIGRVPDKDPWSYNTEATKWYNISWLYDVSISWLNSLLGLPGLIAVNILLAALTPAVLARISFLYGSGVIATLAASSIALIMLKSCFALRPQQFSLFLISMILLLLCKFRLKEQRNIWWIPLFMALLVNIHGSFLLVFVLIGAFWLEAVRNGEWSRARVLTGVGLACVVATFFNPYTYEIYYASWLTLGSEIGKYHIIEWQPAGLTTHPHIYFYALLALSVPLFLRVRLPLADRLLLIFWVVMALNSARYNVVLALFITPFLALFISALTAEYKKFAVKEHAIIADLNRQSVVQSMGVAIFLVAVLLLTPTTRNIMWKKELYDPEKYPVQEIAYLMEHVKDARVLNHYNYGGYLIYQSKGAIQPFVDGRADTVYSKDFLKDYVDIEAFNYGWQELVDKYKLKYALLPNDHRNIEWISKSASWEKVFEGPVASIYRYKKAAA